MKWIVVLAMCLVVAGVAGADVPTYLNGMGNKIDRGFCNVLGAPVLEVPYQVYSTSKEKSVPKGMTVGLAKGIVLTPLRMLSGSYDMVTFFIPFPKDFGSLIKPDYIPWVERSSVE